MILKSFEIKSYRSCIKTEIIFHPELTGLIGINGAGKSNILNGIQIMRKICQSRYIPFKEKDTSFNKCQIKAEIQYEDKSIYLKGDVTFVTDEKNADEVLNSELKWNLGEFTGDNNWLNIPIELIAFNENRHINPNYLYAKMKRSKDLDKYFNVVQKNRPLLIKLFTFFNGINYYSASQFSDPSRSPVSIELEEQRAVRRTRTFASHEQYIHDLYRSWNTKSVQFKRYYNTIGKNGIGLIDDISFTEVEMPSSSYEVQSGGKIKKIEKNRLLVVPSFSIDGYTLSPNQLSEGSFKTLALLFYILTDDSNMLLIEEPEVCIHHGLLNSIISLIKTQSKFKQIIISTHSDFVLDQLTPENLVLIKRQPGKGTVAKTLNKTMSNNDYKALRVYLEESGNLGEYWKEGGFSDE